MFNAEMKWIIIGLGILILLVVLFEVAIYTYYWSKNRILESKLIKTYNELQCVFEYNKNIRKYNLYTQNLNRLYYLIIHMKVDVLSFEEDFKFVADNGISECEVYDISKEIDKIKNEINKCFAKKQYYIYHALNKLNFDYYNWGVNYKKNVISRDNVILKRIEQLDYDWENLHELGQKATSEYPKEIRVRILKIMEILLLNRKQVVMLDKDIEKIECEVWNGKSYY